MSVELVPPWRDCFISDRNVWYGLGTGGHVCQSVAGLFTLTLLLSALPMCVGDINNHTYSAPICAGGVQGNTNIGAHQHLCSGRGFQHFPSRVWQLNLKPPIHDFFNAPWQASLLSGGPTVSLPGAESCCGWGPLCYHVFTSPDAYMWSFYPLLCRRCLLRPLFFLRVHCFVCRCRFSVYVWKGVGTAFPATILGLLASLWSLNAFAEVSFSGKVISLLSQIQEGKKLILTLYLY